MTDDSVCAAMTLGPPQVSVAALGELRSILSHRSTPPSPSELTRFLYRAFGTMGFAHFIASARASAATGRSDSCRVACPLDSPTGVSHLFTAHFEGLLTEL